VTVEKVADAGIMTIAAVAYASSLSRSLAVAVVHFDKLRTGEEVDVVRNLVPKLRPLGTLGKAGSRAQRSSSLFGSKSRQPKQVPARAFSAVMRPQRTAPGPGQESVWDYPRPPRVEKVNKKIEIVFNGEKIVSTTDAYRVLETSHPPVYYIPQKDIQMQYVRQSRGSSFCEWKGPATYWTVHVGNKTASNVGWSYESPSPDFRVIKSHIAFYCAPMDSCTVDGEVVLPQPGGFYGGWITKDIVGPFKGGAGSWGW